MIISVFGALSVIGVSADESTFWVNTVEDIPIEYKITNDGIFKEVEVVSPMRDIFYMFEIPNGKVTIPETVVHDNVEYTVTSIGEDAFSFMNIFHGSYLGGCHVCNKSLKNITIPDSVKCIKKMLFSIVVL